MNNDRELAFIYRDVFWNITFRHIMLLSENDIHINAICLTAREFRTFRKDHVLEMLADISIAEERLQYHRTSNPNYISPDQRINLKNSSRKLRKLLEPEEICFTGFKAADKERLSKFAKSNGLLVRSSVTSNLSYLCFGYNAGPVKIERARSQGVILLNENQFENLIETGEIPEQEESFV